MWTYNESVPTDELYHYGVLGMKWGRRKKYYNSDGSLNEKGKTQASKEYKKHSKKVMNSLSKRYNKMYIDSYIKAANDMNSGGIAKFNAEQKKKYGDDFAKRKGYESDYDKEFDKKMNEYFKKSLADFYKGNKNFKKSEELVKKYNMDKWDELVKSNEEEISKLRRYM